MRTTLEILQEECARAHQTVERVRSLWVDLYRCIDARAAAYNALEHAKAACQVAAERLNITTLPINGAALAEVRAGAESAAHENFKLAREALARAQARAPHYEKGFVK